MSTATMYLTFSNQTNSGQPDDKVWICVIGIDPKTNDPAYLDMGTGTLKTYSSYQSGTTSQTIKQIKAAGNKVSVPAIQSARIYIATGQDFSSMAAGGPGTDEQTLYDKVEFDTHSPGWYNINQTNVDFYGLSYTVTVGKETRGLSQSRSTIVKSLFDLPTADAKNKENGNPDVYRWTFKANNKGEIVRVFSPKSPGLTDWGATKKEYEDHATICSHYFDTYITKHCFPAKRKFTFYDKFWPGTKNQRWAKVDDQGKTISIYSNDQYTGTPDTTLNVPVAPWPKPDMKNPSNYHNDNSASVDGIDWGYILFGNVNGTGAASDWGIDPAAMAIMVSICRGVAHMDPGTTKWTDPKNFYLGDGQGNNKTDMPIFYFSKKLHDLGGGAVYVLSYDDVYGQNSSLPINSGETVTITLDSAEIVKPVAM